MTTPSLPPLGLYLHLPWCVRKCPYCDFNSHAAPEALPVRAYLDALRADLDGELQLTAGRPLESVFIGGGTPSLFPPEAIGEVLEWLAPHLAADAEITLEANPGTLEQGRFTAFRGAGVNRLSIGVQSFDDQRLEALGRIHGGTEARRAIDACHAAGFETFNVDLMFALPGQDTAGAIADVDAALELGAPHVSHYQLTIEPNTVFHRYPPTRPSEEAAWEMQAACAQRLDAAGLRRYEVSAWGRPGHACRHNLNYWRFGDYLAAGAGAHGKVTDPASGAIRRYRKVTVPALYMERARTGDANAGAWCIEADERPLEFVMNALRLDEGFELATFTTRTGLARERIVPILEGAASDGLVTIEGERIRATAVGQDHLDTLLQRFLPEAPCSRR